LLAVLPAQAQQVLQTFTLAEHFGISHPDQIIDFDLNQPVDPALSRLLDAQGREVLYQVSSDGKRLVLRTGLLPGEVETWRLVRGKPAAPSAGAVRIERQANCWEITNGLTGVRLPLETAALDPPPAPVQGVLYRDGTWSGLGPNLLTARASAFHSLTVRFRERGPLKVVAEVGYQLTRAELRSNQDGSLLIPAGEGFYRCTVEVQAGQPSVLFEEDADTEVSWSLNLYPGLEPTQARYRGHHATAPEYGREPDGQRYRATNERSVLDALVDVHYDRAMAAAYAATPSSYRYMAVWDPWIFDSGWYWQFYNAQAPDTANLVGIFAGPPSRALGAVASGVGLFTKPEPRQAGITVAINRMCADARWWPRVRFAWGLFLGVKGQDLKPPTEIQPINRQMNVHAGINLNKVHRYLTEYPDPPQGYGALYMPRQAVQRLIQRLRTDRVFHDFCWNAEPQSRALIELLSDASGEKARAAADEVVEFGRFLLDVYVNRDGIYHPSYSYWQAGQAMTEKAVWIDYLLASDQISAEQRAGLKAVASAFGNLLWDDDFVPLFTEHGLNLAQGPIQYLGFRSFYALFLSGQPLFRERAADVERATLASLPAIINEHGAGVACTHYMAPYVATSLNALLQLQRLGKDHFRTEPRLAKFAEFYMNFLTPPEPRFGGLRKYIALSDSSTESSELYGVLATGFREADPELSARLMGAWVAGGRRLDPRFGSCLLRIDFEAPAKDPNLGSATFPGYYSVLRYGWGTPNETAVWMINGDFYREHRHPDQGMIVIYALGAPVSVHWSSLYSPQVPGAFLNSTVLLEDMTGHPWDRDNPPLTAGGGWTDSTQEAFLSFAASAYARAHFRRGNTIWTRATALIHPRDDLPLLLIRDVLSGENATRPAVLTLNLMAQGPVETPAGTITPTLRTAKDNELPSAGPVFALGPGVSRLGFTGQHLIDWDLYSVSGEPQQALVGNWAVNWHQEVSPFEERQHILRLRATGPFTTLLLPYRKAECPAGRTVTAEGDRIRVVLGEEETLIGPTWWGYRKGEEVVAVAALDADAAQYAGVSISGGPAEVVIQGPTALGTLHGAPGVRRVVIPGDWKPAPNAAVEPVRENGLWRLDYPGGAPVSVRLTR